MGGGRQLSNNLPECMCTCPHLLPNYANAVQFQSVCVVSLLSGAPGFSTIPSERGEALYKSEKNECRVHFSPCGGRQHRSAGTHLHTALLKGGGGGLGADAGQEVIMVLQNTAAVSTAFPNPC